MDSRSSPVSLYLFAPEQALLESWPKSLKSRFSLLVYRDSRRTAPLPITVTPVAPSQCRKHSIRLSPERLAELDARRAEVGLSRSDYLRLLLQWGDRRYAEPIRAKSTGGIGCTAGNVSIPAATPAASSVHPGRHPAASSAAPTPTPDVGCTAVNVSIPMPVPSPRAAARSGLHPSASSPAGRSDAVERERAARAALRQRADDADEAEVTRLCAIHDARVAAQASAARLAAGSASRAAAVTTAPTDGSPVLWSLEAPAAPMPTPPFRAQASERPAPVIAPASANHVAQPIRSQSANSTKEGKMPHHEDGTSIIERVTILSTDDGSADLLDAMRKRIHDNGAETKPFTLVLPDAPSAEDLREVAAVTRPLRLGGAFRIVLGLDSGEIGIPLRPFLRDEMNAANSVVIATLEAICAEEEIYLTVKPTGFQPFMSQDGERLPGFAEEPEEQEVAEDGDEDDDDDDSEDANDDDEIDGDASATDDEPEHGLRGVVMSLMITRTK